MITNNFKNKMLKAVIDSIYCFSYKFNGEIISADSLYIYKDLNIGTAKPSTLEMAGIKHHLIDVVEPTSSFSVSDYESLALPIVNELISKGKIPIICGGTGFYINSILYDGVSDINFMYVVNPPEDNLPYLNKDNGWLSYIIRYALLAVLCVSMCYIKPIILKIKELIIWISYFVF